jgi:hypothetical protein
MCGTIDPGSCIRWVLDFSIKTRYDITQVFYVNDPDPANREEHHIIIQGKRKIVGVEDVVNEEEYNQFNDLPPFGEDITIPTIDDTEKPTYIRRDHDEAIIVR